MENPNSGSKRIDDKDLARKMAYAGDKQRTYAAQHRTWANDSESPKTLKGKIIKKITGEARAKDVAERLRHNADLIDGAADIREQNVKIIHDTKEEIKELNDSEVEKLIDQTRWQLNNPEQTFINKGVGELDINELLREENRLAIRLKTLRRLLKERQAIRDRITQEKNSN